MNMILTFLQNNWERLELEQYCPTRQLSSVLITPHFRASSHVVYLIMPQGQPDPVLVAKVPRLTGPSASVMREVANLRAVQASRAQGFNTIPRVIAFEEYASRQFLLETALIGKPMDPPTVRRDPDRCCRVVLDWLTELQIATSKRTNGDSDWYEEQVSGPISRFRELLPLSREEERWVAISKLLVTPLQTAGLPLVFKHGDLSHPNVMWLNDRQPAVVDWELADPQGLPGIDLFMFLTYVAFSKHATRASGAYLPAFQEAFFGDAAWTIPFIKVYCDRLGLTRDTMLALFVLTWLRYISSLLERLKETSRSSEVIGAKTTAWIRDNRYYQLWQYVVHHVDELKWTVE